MPPRIRLIALAAALGLALAAAGCGSSHHSLLSPATDRAAPSASALSTAAPEPGCAYGPRGFYPLAIGNRWHYQRQHTERVVDSTGATLGRYDETGYELHEQICSEALAGHQYLVERQTTTGNEWIQRMWIWFRQDAGALYENDSTFRPVCDPPGNSDDDLRTSLAAAGRAIDEGGSGGAGDRLADLAPSAAERAAWTQALQIVRGRAALLRGLGHGSWLRHPGPRVPPQGELLRQRYPLVPGQSWVIRLEPIRFTARVERLDVLQLLPGAMPAWRIAYTVEGFGPHDRIHVWYGRQGFLQMKYHLESPRMAPDGTFSRTAISEETVTLDSLSLVRPSLLADAAGERP